MACAWASGMPARSPIACAAASAEAMTMRRPSCMRVMSGTDLSGASLPNWRRQRSVGQVGSQTQATLRITSLHDPGCGLSAAASDKVDPPAHRAEPLHLRRVRHWRRRWQAADAPAADRGERRRQSRIR